MVQILDCTIRDGGYLNNWQFDKKIVREVYRACSKAGVDFVEVGFRSTEKYFDKNKFGIWKFSPEDVIANTIKGISGSKIAIMGDYGKIDLNDLDEKSNSAIDLVRIAANKTQVYDTIDFLEKIKAKGYLTSLQAMGFSGYTDKEKTELKQALKSVDLDYFYIADSYGSFFPNQIEDIFSPFIELKNIKIGFHPHNNLQMSFANTLETLRCGVDIIDATIYGMGRAAGNLPLETIIAYLELSSQDKYNVVPILSCIDKYFIEMQKQTPWGYLLPYMISGIFKCHPNYASDLVNRREYTIEDIWKAMEEIKKIDPVGFSKDINDDLIKKGVVGGFASSGVDANKDNDSNIDLDPKTDRELKNKASYLDRHVNRDFLILANGPSLKEYTDKINDFIKKYNPVVLGANFLETLFEPDYHAFTSKKRFMSYVDSVKDGSKLLIGQNIPEAMIKDYTTRDYETLKFKDVLDNKFDVINGEIQTNCRTVSVLLIGVAIVMGAERVFVAGMDGYVDISKNGESLYYNEKDEPYREDDIMQRHKWNERFLFEIDDYLQKMGKDGIHIITPTAHKSFYKGISNYLPD